MLTRPQLLVSSAYDFVALGDQSVHTKEVLLGDWIASSDDGTWDTRFVSHVGTRSQIDRRTKCSAWPFPPITNASEMFRAALEGGLLREDPEPGDIFTAWSPAKKRFVRSGLIVTVESSRIDAYGRLNHECVTVEGDLNERADGRGSQVPFVRRMLSVDKGDRFIRWADALPNIEDAAA